MSSLTTETKNDVEWPLYQSLNHSSCSLGTEDRQQPRQYVWPRRASYAQVMLYLFAGAVVASLTILGRYSFGRYERNFISTQADTVPCGNTPEDAMAAGCIYDEVLLHWMPSSCSDPELINEIVHAWPWVFYTSKIATHQLTAAEVRSGNQDIKWVSQELHRWHCVATWKILSSAAALGNTVPGYALDYNHTNHCTDHVLLNKHSENPFAINSKLDIEYTPCLPLAVDRIVKRRKAD